MNILRLYSLKGVLKISKGFSTSCLSALWAHPSLISLRGVKYGQNFCALTLSALSQSRPLRAEPQRGNMVTKIIDFCVTIFTLSI
jgi:hypothetical protein